jgi:murein DD-endopeptidase MepM/ murein hydrolase activator NlpD
VKSNRWRRCARTVITTTAAGLAVLMAALPAAADPADDKARVDRELAKTKAALEASSERVETAAVALAEANRRMPAVERRLADARGLLASARAKATTAATAVRTASAKLTAADRAVTRATNRVDRTREQIAEYAVSAYMGRDVAGVDALLSLSDPADFVAGLTYLDHIAQGQTRALNAGTRARNDAEIAKDVQVQRKREADQARRQANAAVRRAAEAEADAARAEAEVAAVVDQRARALGVAEDERAATEARYKELQAESARIAAAIRKRAAGGGPVVQPGARLLMPVDGWKSSDFGMRLDPVYGVWRLHAGTDFAAGGGSSIWAARAGEVLRAGWNGGYGNYTCLYHGTYQRKGFATCYAHQSAILVRVGQQVRQGQVIGRVGTTGASTGNHLHFEVRLDGTPVNPIPWLPACLC